MVARRNMLHKIHVRLLLTVAILCISVVSAARRSNETSAFDGVDQRMIVGGNQASIGEYPYFVSTRRGGCGGVLIASEYVLTAIHCGNIAGQEVLIGPYRIRSTDYGGRKRTCTNWKRHPSFQYNGGTLDSPRAPFQNDIALCKLDEPIYVDDSKVSLRVNDNGSYPSVGTDVVAVGFGTTSSGGSQPEFLREVTVKVNRNSDCAAAPNPAYSGQSIRPGIICASVPGGGKDACQGDSGGPLVRRTNEGGKRVDYHVGVTSWGIGCADSRFPGVYSRTAYGYSFIRQTICTEGRSPSPFCRTTSVNCGSNKEKLEIRVVSDKFPDDISWTLTRIGHGTVRSKSNFNKKYMTYEDHLCLEKGRVYKFTINDGYGDGLTAGEKGFYSLSLDGKVIKRSSSYGRQDVTEFRTQSNPTKRPTKRPTKKPTKRPTKRPTKPPTETTQQETPQKRGPCNDKSDYRFKGIEQNSCYEMLEGKTRNQRNEICERRDETRNGKKIKYFCSSYCRRRCRRGRKEVGRTGSMKTLRLRRTTPELRKMEKSTKG